MRSGRMEALLKSHYGDPSRVEAQNTPSWGEFLSLRHRRHEVLGARCNLPPEATLCLLLSSTSLVRRPCFWQSNSGYLVLSHTTFGSQNDQLCWSHGIQQPLQIDGLADDIVILSVVIINRLFSNIRVVHHKSHPQTCRPGLIITRRRSLDPYVVSHSITRVSIGLTTSIQSTPRTDYAKREDR